MKLRFRLIAGALLALWLVPSTFAFADESTLINMIKDLQKQMGTMQSTINQQNQKIQNLESRPASSGSAPAAEIPPPMSDYEFNERLNGALGGANKWLKDLSFKGDLRLRYEAFQQTSGHPSETDDRNRFRYRLRFGFEKKFSEEMKIGFSLASGEASSGQNVDPTSTNTTFDNNFNFKDIFVEKAWAGYSPNWLKKGPITEFHIRAGKLDNPFEKGSSDIVWDRDVKPEGVYEKVDIDILQNEDVRISSFLTAGQFVLDEDSVSGGDAELFAHQAGLNFVVYVPFLDRPLDLLSAVSYYSFLDYADRSNFTIGGTSLARGNPNVTGRSTELDTRDFEVFEIYHELAFYPFGVPVRPFLDWAMNLDSQVSSEHHVAALPENATLTSTGHNEDNAWALGVKIGSIVKKGDWEISYAYKRIEANAVPGFNDSDFGTTGHSAKRGSVFKAGYALTDALSLNLAAIFVNNLNTGTNGIRDEEQRRFQTDLVWKF